MEISRQCRIFPSYSAGTGLFNVAASATDIALITGSATKRVVVQRIIIGATQTTGGSVNVVLAKRSADDSGGTAVTDTAVPLDSANPASGVTLRHYTANPAGLGALVGNIWNTQLYIGAPAALYNTFALDFTIEGRHPPVLRGVAQVLAVNLAAVTVTGGSFDITWEWTEEFG